MFVHSVPPRPPSAAPTHYAHPHYASARRARRGFALATAFFCFCFCLAPALQARDTGKAPRPQPGAREIAFPVSGAASGQEAGAPSAEGTGPPPAECVVRTGPAVRVAGVAFSPDGRLLAAAGYGEVLLWDLDKGELAKRVGAGRLAGFVNAVVFLDEGKLLAAADGVPQESGSVKIFNVATGALDCAFQQFQDAVYCLALSPDRKLLAAGAADAKVCVWDLESRTLAASLKQSAGWPLAVCFSPDGKKLAAGGTGRTLQIWETGAWDQTPPADLPVEETIHGIAFDPRAGTVLAAVGGASARGISIRSVTSKKSPRMISTGAGMPLGVQYVGESNSLIVPCSDGTVKAVALWGNRALRTFEGHSDWVYCAALDPKGGLLASGGADGTVRLWEFGSGNLRAALVHLAPKTDNWVIVTAQGFAATSMPQAVAWKTGDQDIPAQQISARFNADEVRHALKAPPAAPQRQSRVGKGAAKQSRQGKRPSQAQQTKPGS